LTWIEAHDLWSAPSESDPTGILSGAAASRNVKTDPLAVPNRVELCKTDDVAEGTALRVETGDLIVAVFNIEGQFYVTDDQCTHGPGSLSEGYIDGDVVECNFHNGQFDIRTGEVVSPPCMIPVRTYPVTVENGAVTIEVD
jgi:nitrite reductase/ring-hydroxylating ferredoxin subunit